MGGCWLEDREINSQSPLSRLVVCFVLFYFHFTFYCKALINLNLNINGRDAQIVTLQVFNFGLLAQKLIFFHQWLILFEQLWNTVFKILKIIIWVIPVFTRYSKANPQGLERERIDNKFGWIIDKEFDFILCLGLQLTKASSQSFSFLWYCLSFFFQNTSTLRGSFYLLFCVAKIY